MNEDKATRYHRLDRQAGLLSLLCNTALLVCLLASGGSGAMRDWAVAATIRTGFPSALRPAAVVGLYAAFLVLLAEIVVLPLRYYRSFVLERRYGLSTETSGRWLKDHCKAGLMARAPRIILLAIGLFFNGLSPWVLKIVVWIMAVLLFETVFERLIEVWKALAE